MYAPAFLLLLLHTSLALGSLGLRGMSFAALAGIESLDKRETCYGTCVSCYGTGYRICVGNYCFNPDLGQICCSNGGYCEAGFYCTLGGCCPNGEHCGYSQVSTVPGSSQAPSASSLPPPASSSSLPPPASSSSLPPPASSSSLPYVLPPVASSSTYVQGPGGAQSTPYSSPTSAIFSPFGGSTSGGTHHHPTPVQSTSTGGFGISPSASSSTVVPGSNGAPVIQIGSISEMILGIVTWLFFIF